MVKGVLTLVLLGCLVGPVWLPGHTWQFVGTFAIVAVYWALALAFSKAARNAARRGVSRLANASRACNTSASAPAWAVAPPGPHNTRLSATRTRRCGHRLFMRQNLAQWR